MLSTLSILLLLLLLLTEADVQLSLFKAGAVWLLMLRAPSCSFALTVVSPTVRFRASRIAVVRVNNFKLIIGPKLRNVLTSSHLFKFQELKECERKQDCVASSYSKGISPNQLSKNKTAAVSCQTAGYLRAR